MKHLIAEKERYNFIDTTNILSNLNITERSSPIKCRGCTSDKVRIRMLVISIPSIRRRWIQYL